MSYKFEIGCACAITNYDVLIMLARNATSWLALPFWGGMGEASFFIYPLAMPCIAQFIV